VGGPARAIPFAGERREVIIDRLLPASPLLLFGTVADKVIIARFLGDRGASCLIALTSSGAAVTDATINILA
jgi:hypothetical protein